MGEFQVGMSFLGIWARAFKMHVLSIFVVFILQYQIAAK